MDDLDVGDYVVVRWGRRNHLGVIKVIYSRGYLVDLLSKGSIYFKAEDVRKATNDDINKYIP